MQKNETATDLILIFFSFQRLNKYAVFVVFRLFDSQNIKMYNYTQENRTDIRNGSFSFACVRPDTKVFEISKFRQGVINNAKKKPYNLHTIRRNKRDSNRLRWTV